eukprot:gene3675-biopygen1662
MEVITDKISQPCCSKTCIGVPPPSAPSSSPSVVIAICRHRHLVWVLPVAGIIGRCNVPPALCCRSESEARHLPAQSAARHLPSQLPT